jgi:hypothetical protein
MPLGNAPRMPEGSMTDGTYGSLVQDVYETVPALTYPLSIQTYAKMRRDPQIKAVLNAYTLPMRSASWAINPRGCRDEVVELVADAWGLPIAGDNDDGPGPARRRGVQWDDHLRVALLMLTFGHSPFVQWYDIGGTPLRARLAGLSERLPQTIADIQANEDGTLKGIVQSGKRDLIPARNLLWYVHEREGAAWQGNSMIREAYAPWLLKHEMWRVIAQSGRRFGMGVPQVSAPAGSPPADVTRAAEIAASFRAGDQAGIGLPAGFTFDLKGMIGSVPDMLGFVNYLDAQIATSALAEIFNLDTSANGSRALGDTVIGLLEMAWQATAREVMGPANALNVQMVDYNFGEEEPVPGLLATDITRPEVTSEAISALVSCGALTPDLGMENDLRNRFHLPQINERPEPAAPDTVTGPANERIPEAPQGTTGDAPPARQVVGA